MPYHTPNCADGLAFSCKNPHYIPPSLKNIYREIEDDVYNGLNMHLYLDYTLDKWAEQGILLLNTALTVEKGLPESHIHLWRGFTETVISKLNDYKNGTIWLLWGSKAKKWKKYISSDTNFILESGHPSPLSANRKLWFGNKHFSTVNQILYNQNGDKILW